MLFGLLLIALVITGLCWLFGAGKPDRLVKFLCWLLAGPLLFGLLYSEWLILYSDLPTVGQFAVIISIPFLFIFSLKVLFPGSKAIAAINAVLWDLWIFTLTFPIRLMWRSARQIAARESTKVRLQRHRVVVGGRPPVQRESSDSK